MKVNLLLLALAALLQQATAAKPLCIGYKEFPKLNADCRARADEAACMKGFSLRSKDLAASCIWHRLANTKTIDRQIVYNRAGSVIVSGINHQGTVCTTNMKVTLPSSAKGRWGSYMRLLSGPQNTSVYIDSTSPRDAFATSSCTTTNKNPNTCTVENVAPKGYALTPAFRENSAVLEFSTTDKKLMDEWRANQRLPWRYTLKFRMDIEGTRCKNPDKYPKATPALLDEVAFGASSFMLNENPQHYFLRTYRAYKVTNVTGIDWSVKVTESLHKSGNKSRITSMLMREKDYFAWADECRTSCRPPVDLALRNTVCKGLDCARRFRGLGPKRGSYRLLVSYPVITSFLANASFGDNAPVDTRFKDQIVRTEIWPRRWGLEPLSRRQEEPGAKEAVLLDDGEAPAPDAEEAEASQDQNAGEARSYMPDDMPDEDTPLIKPIANLAWSSEAKQSANG